MINTMTDAPTTIRSLTEDSVLQIHWPDGTVRELPYRFLRSRCPCAGCVDELTGVRTLDATSIPDDIAPTNIGFSGNYALKFTWSDGHHTGLYTWDYLTELGSEISEHRSSQK